MWALLRINKHCINTSTRIPVLPQIACSPYNDQHSTCSANRPSKTDILPYRSRTDLFKAVFSTSTSMYYLSLRLCFESEGERSLFFLFFDFLLTFLLDGDLMSASFLRDLLSLSHGVNEQERALLFLFCLLGDELPYLSHEPPSLFLDGVLRKKLFELKFLIN